MRNVIYSMMVSLDGYVAAPDGSLDWVVIDEELHTFVNDQQRDIDIYLHGRGMYELLAAYWPTADADPDAPAYIVEFARIWRDMPKIVFSRTLQHVAWNARLAQGSLANEIAALKAQPGKDVDLGGPALAASAMKLGLIDECRLFVNPVVLGAGIPLFPPLQRPLNFRLVETRAFGSGVVYLHYRRAG